MSFFEQYFSDTVFSGEETMVCCPFPHLTTNGLEYYESNPSAGINLEKGVYHCLSCGKSLSEVGFISQILNTSYEIATRLKEAFDKNETIDAWKEYASLPKEIHTKINDLGISDAVIEDLLIRSEDGKAISFPVTLFGTVLDIRNYRPKEFPKMRGRKDSIAGLVLPFDLWKNSNPDRWTLLCAGEKDMAVARTMGFNAITLTGGEMKTPVFTAPFKNRRIAIAYDNDEAGHTGAQKIAASLKPLAKEVRIVKGFHEVCVEPGEDITDFFTKYDGTREQLIHYIETASVFTEEECEAQMERITPTVTLNEAARPQNINKTVRSNLQIIATNEASYVVPTAVICEKKFTYNKPNEHMQLKETRSWYLSENTLKDILHLIDNKFVEEVVEENIKELSGVPAKEPGVVVRRLSKEVVYKCSVTDLLETSNNTTNHLEYTAYVVGKQLESGKKYKATYRLVPHPYDGQRLIMIILNVSEATDSVTNFKVTDSVIKNLKFFQALPGNVKQKVETLTNSVRGLTKFNTDSTLIQAIDLTYNTVLEFNFRNFKNIRGYLDTIIVTESRVGKSSTAEALQKAYGLGVFTSLAGASATVAGIIGGSNKVNGSFQTRAGLIPQNHRGLIVFEELAKCNSQILKELTDIKSSGRVRITRVNGVLDLPALVRMVSLTNTRSAPSGPPRPITSYPNGIEILTDLIGDAADIARFDIMLVQAFRGTAMDPFWEQPDSIPEENLRTRIRWIWSRKPEQVIISKDVETFVINQCNALNEKYDSHIKIFGTEAWKKVTRLAIAVAGYVVSASEDYESIVVTEEHVNFAIEFYTKIYDNETFRLHEYVNTERRFEQVDDDGIHALQQLYITFPTLLSQLEGSSTCTRNELMAATGLSTDHFNSQINHLVQGSFVRFQGQFIMPTLRFRKCMKSVNRNTTIVKIGGFNNVFKKVE